MCKEHVQTNAFNRCPETLPVLQQSISSSGVSINKRLSISVKSPQYLFVKWNVLGVNGIYCSSSISSHFIARFKMWLLLKVDFFSSFDLSA